MSPVTPPIPLLLVADSAETCERIASALLTAPAFYRIERVTSEELARNGAPSETRLALVDGPLQTGTQSQVVRQLNGGGLPVVALVDARDVQTLQEVVLAGAAALVATPFDDTQFWETVATALDKGPSSSAGEPGSRGRSRSRTAEGQVIVVYGPKGGSGTSVIAANLAVSLQARTERGAVLVEIGEGMGSQALLLNLRADRTVGDLVARFEPGDSELISGVLAKHPSGLCVLLAPASPGLRIPPDLLDDVMTSLQLMFDFIVLDLQSASRTIAPMILRRATSAVVVITPEMTSLNHGRQFVETIEATIPGIRLNVVLNRSTIQGGVPGDAIRRHLKMQIMAEIPDDAAVVTGSVNRGIPWVTSHPRSAVARAVQKLALTLAPETEEARAERETAGARSLPFLIGRRRPA